MLRKIIIVTFLVFIQQFECFSQTVSSSCNLNDTVAVKYRKDADRLAVRRVYHISSSYRDTVKINKVISSVYLRALIAVYNATALPARDTVIKLINIHTKADPDLNGYSISADSNLIWMKNIRNNIYPTGLSLLDSSILNYGFQKTQYQSTFWVPYHSVTYKADTNINSLPLANHMYTVVPGIYGCGPDAVPFDGPNIVDSVNANFTDLIYYYGWDDCALGCINQRFWKFRVYSNNCTVEYMGDYGAALPGDVGLSKNSLIFENIRLFPNPSKGKIELAIIGVPFQDLALIIQNSLGQILFEQKATVQNQQIDVSEFKSGLYFLKVSNEHGQNVLKFIKE